MKITMPRRARMALQDWASRYSGYDEHMEKLHPPQGYLTWGDVRFTINTITFSGGKIHVKATAGATEAGQVKGRVTVLGTDELPAFQGVRAEDMGIKMSGTSWEFTWDADLSRITADDRPDAPQPA